MIVSERIKQTNAKQERVLAVLRNKLNQGCIDVQYADRLNKLFINIKNEPFEWQKSIDNRIRVAKAVKEAGLKLCNSPENFIGIDLQTSSVEHVLTLLALYL